MLASGVLAATAVAACGSSASAGGAAQAQGCTAVAAVLSNGPDPDVDPVGYAEAQVLPLHQLKLSGTILQDVVNKLGSAYKAYASNGGRPLAAGVASEEKALNAICPGAAP